MCRHFMEQNQQLLSNNNSLLQKMQKKSQEMDKMVERSLLVLLQQTCPALLPQ